MSYKQYISSTRKITEEPLVTIGAGGNVYLNAFAMRNYFKDIKNVAILYDTENRCFAIKPITEDQKGAYSLNFSSQKSKSTGVVAARGFANLPWIKQSKVKKFKALWNEKQEFLEIKMVTNPKASAKY